MDKHIHWWKHVLKVYSPILLMWVFVIFLGTELYIASQMAGFAAFGSILMNFVFRFFKNEKYNTKGYKIGFWISLMIGIFVLPYFTNANLLAISVAGITFYLTRFIKFEPKKS